VVLRSHSLRRKLAISDDDIKSPATMQIAAFSPSGGWIAWKYCDNSVGARIRDAGRYDLAFICPCKPSLLHLGHLQREVRADEGA